MKFNRAEFMDETGGNIDFAMNCIDELLRILADYAHEDMIASLHGSGCYGKQAPDVILERIRHTPIKQYLETE